MSIIDIKIDRSFKTFFDRKDILDEINKIDIILDKNKYYPLENEVLRFATYDLNNIKCIILGMDPYPSDFEDEGKILPIATGRSFEVRNIYNWVDNYRQTSLQNILKSLYYLKYKKIENIKFIKEKIKDKTFNIINMKNLWDNDNILWLNATLTVTPHKSGSHIKYWSYFMDELIKYIVDHNKDIIWLIWGEDARDRVEGLVPIENIIYNCHPASRVNNDFIEKCPFQYIKNIDFVY